MIRNLQAMLVALALLLTLSPDAMADRVNLQITITAGTPVRIATNRLFVDRLSIQSKHGNTGLVYVMLGVPAATTCDATNAAHLSGELGPGDATHPGGQFVDPQGANGMTPSDIEDLSLACIDGSHTADVVIVTFWRRI